MRTAEEIHAEMTANIDRFYGWAMTIEEFRDRQGELWAEAKAAGVAGELVERVADATRPKTFPR